MGDSPLRGRVLALLAFLAFLAVLPWVLGGIGRFAESRFVPPPSDREICQRVKVPGVPITNPCEPSEMAALAADRCKVDGTFVDVSMDHPKREVPRRLHWFLTTVHGAHVWGEDAEVTQYIALDTDDGPLFLWSAYFGSADYRWSGLWAECPSDEPYGGAVYTLAPQPSNAPL